MISLAHELFMSEHYPVTLIKIFLPSRFLCVNPLVKRLMERFFQNYNSCLSCKVSFKITTMLLSEWIQSDSPMPVQNKSGKLLHKQECIMADESAQFHLVLWEDDINKLVPVNKYYKLILGLDRERDHVILD